MNELALAAAFCSFLAGGEREERQNFTAVERPHYIRVDCETPRFVIEIGFDNKNSSRDSVHQAVFAAALTGKTPGVVLIDTDGVEGRYEYEMRLVTKHLGIPLRICSEDHVVAWQMTSGFRKAGRDKSLDDLPRPSIATGYCDLQIFASD